MTGALAGSRNVTRKSTPPPSNESHAEVCFTDLENYPDVYSLSRSKSRHQVQLYASWRDPDLPFSSIFRHDVASMITVTAICAYLVPTADPAPPSTILHPALPDPARAASHSRPHAPCRLYSSPTERVLYAYAPDPMNGWIRP